MRTDHVRYNSFKIQNNESEREYLEIVVKKFIAESLCFD